MRIALGVEYDGSGYNGWQCQPDVPNVQDALQLALSGIAGESISILAAGRTDTGVHALGMVAHFEIPRAECKLPMRQLALGDLVMRSRSRVFPTFSPLTQISPSSAT